MKEFFIKLSAALSSIALSVIATYFVFNSTFIKISIDYLSFAAGIFLFLDASFAIVQAKGFSLQREFTRLVRMVFGLCIITIHLGQFFNYRIVSSRIAEIQINWVDYLAVLASLFLIIEGLTKMLTSNSPIFPTQVSRLFRVAIGAIVLTIHVLQFVHCWGK